MSFEIKKVYTDNPYVDELVYYTRVMGLNTVLKMQQQADMNETAESIKNADFLIMCVENTVTYDMFQTISAESLIYAGITIPEMIKRYLSDKSSVPIDKRPRITEYLSKEFIRKYDDLNPYYRMLHGLPAVGREDYIEDWIPPDDAAIDLEKPIHEMNSAELAILNQYHVLEDMIKEDPKNRQYMRYLGDKKIDYYTARKAGRFETLYIPPIDSDVIYKMYKDRLNMNKNYVLRTVYSEAYNYDSDYYDNFIAIFIVLITVIDIISRVQEFIAKKEIFDIRSVQYIFKSNGVPFYEDIPLKYQIAMVKNIHTLLKYKSTKKCMIDICALFGFSNIKIFKYYLLRDRKIDFDTGEYIYAEDENGKEDISKEYDLKFLKVPLEDDIDDYVLVGGNYINYNEITNADPSWTGGRDPEEVKSEILREEFNFIKTKYISINTSYDIAKMAMQQSYFFNFLYDNVYIESMLNIKIPFIETGKSFNIAHVFIFLNALGYYYNKLEDSIITKPSDILYVNGFNFRANMSILALEVANDLRYVYSKSASDHINDLMKRFKMPNPNVQIPTFNEMMNIFVNNIEIREELIKGMRTADNKQIYDIYKKIYDSLMVSKLTFEFFEKPDGSIYPTFTEYLADHDTTLYSVLINIKSMEDPNTRNQYIANTIDNVIWSIDEYIDTEEYQSLFNNLPAVSAEVVKTYIATVINFYKSYKVDFLGLNTIYTIEDKNECSINIKDKIIKAASYLRRENIYIDDTAIKNIYLESNDNLGIVDRLWINRFVDITEDNLMDKVNPSDSGSIIVSDNDGNAIASDIKISSEVTGDRSDYTITEKGSIDYIRNSAVTSKDFAKSNDVANSVDTASDNKVITEKAFVGKAEIKIIKDKEKDKGNILINNEDSYPAKNGMYIESTDGTKFISGDDISGIIINEQDI